MELPRVDQPKASDTVEKLWKAVNTAAKKIQFLQAPVASLWTIFSFSIGKVRVLAPLNRTAGHFCLFAAVFHCFGEIPFIKPQNDT